jgi:hypothetical protein
MSEASETKIQLDMVVCLPDGDFSGHLGMDGTEVRVSSCGCEGVREALPWLQ